MSRFLFTVLAAVGMVLSSGGPAPAWSRGGHMVTGAIAYHILAKDSPEALARAIALLKRHPDYLKKWKEEIENPNVPETERDLYLFMIAGRWADDARGDPFYYPEGKHRDRWHYINFPFRPKGEPEWVKAAPPDDINILWAFEHNLAVLTSKDRDEDRAIAATWLFHLIGDVHQPLHTVSLFTTEFQTLEDGKPMGDRGGTRFQIRVEKDGKVINLHQFWDGLVIGTTRFQETRNCATELRNRPEFAREKLTELATSGFEKWAHQESFELAQKAAYRSGDLKGSPSRDQALVLPADYVKTVHPIAERRVVLAGHRIAEILKKAFESE